MPPDIVIIRPMHPTDLPQVVDTHLSGFAGFFLTFLGNRFLKLLYQSISEDSDGLVLVAVSGSAVHGFVAGVTQQVGFYNRLIRRKKWAFAGAALVPCMKHPTIALRLFRALSRPAEVSTSGAQACLMSIAVRPHSAGIGVGQQLIAAFNQELVKRGATGVCLTTDQNNNDRTNRFYQKMGFHLCRTFVTPEGRAMNEYILDLR